MDKVLLDHWSSIELFCRIIDKYETTLNSKSNLDFSKKSELIDHFIDECKNKDYQQKIADEINKVRNNNYKLKFIEARRIYDLSNDINKGREYYIHKKELATIEKYIEGEKIRIQEITPFWRDKTKQVKFDNSRWYLYYYEDYETIDGNGSKEIVRTVIRSAVYIKSFSRIKMDSLWASTNDSRELNGTISTFGEKESYLLISLKTIEQEDEAYYQFHIGNKENIKQLAIGQYHNAGPEKQLIFSGVAILDSYNTLHQKGPISPKIFRQDSEEWKKLPIYVQIYLKDRRSEIGMPTDIDDSNKLMVWLDKFLKSEI